MTGSFVSEVLKKVSDSADRVIVLLFIFSLFFLQGSFMTAAPVLAQEDIPSDEVEKQLGVKVNYRPDSKMITIEGKGKRITMISGRSTIIVNGKFVRLKSPPREVDGQIHIPEELIREVYGAESKKTDIVREKPAVDMKKKEETGTRESAEETEEVKSPAENIKALPDIASSTGPSLIDEIKYKRAADKFVIGITFASRVPENKLKVLASADYKSMDLIFTDVESRLGEQLIRIEESFVNYLKMTLGRNNTAILTVNAGCAITASYATQNNTMTIVVTKKPETDDIVSAISSSTDLKDELKGPLPEDLSRGIEGIDWIIAIDPACGGEEAGVVGFKEIKEKDVTLDVARRLRNIMARTGLRPILLRTGDYYVPMEKRAEAANSTGAKLFVSIAMNGSYSPKARGVEAYYVSNKNVVGTGAIAVGTESVAIADAEIAREVDEMMGQFQKNLKPKESEELARRILSRIVLDTGALDRGVHGVSLPLLANLAMPATVVSIGYLTTREDGQQIADPEHRQKIALAIFNGIKDYIVNTLPRAEVNDRMVIEKKAGRETRASTGDVNKKGSGGITERVQKEGVQPENNNSSKVNSNKSGNEEELEGGGF